MFCGVCAVLPCRTLTQRVTPSYSVERGAVMGCPRFCTPMHRVKRCLRLLRHEEYRNMLWLYDRLLERLGLVIVETVNAVKRMVMLGRERGDDYFFFSEAAEALVELVNMAERALMYADLYALELTRRLDGGCYPLIRDYVDEIIDRMGYIADLVAAIEEIESVFEWVEYQRLARRRGLQVIEHAAELLRKVAAAYGDVIIEAGIMLLHDGRVIPASELLDTKPEDVIESYDDSVLYAVMSHLFKLENEKKEEEDEEV